MSSQYYYQSAKFSENNFLVYLYVHSVWRKITFSTKEDIIDFRNKISKIDKNTYKKSKKWLLYGEWDNNPNINFDEDLWESVLANSEEGFLEEVIINTITFFEKIENIPFRIQNVTFPFEFYLTQNISLWGQLYIKNQYNDKDYPIHFGNIFSLAIFEPFDGSFISAIDNALSIIDNVLTGKTENEILKTVIVTGDHTLFDEYFVVGRETSKYYGFLDTGQCPDEIFSAENAPSVGNVPTLVLQNFLQNLRIFVDNFKIE